MTAPRKYRVLRIAAVTLLILLAVAGAVILSVVNHYKGILRARLPVIAANATDSLYRITAEDFRINIFTKTVSVINLHMLPDTAVVAQLQREGKGPHILLDVMVPEFEIKGLKWENVVTEKTLACEEAGIYHPKISITITEDDPVKDSLKKKTPAIKRVFASNLFIKDPQITFRKEGKDNPFTVKSKGGAIIATDWDFHPGEPADPSRFFYAKSANVMLAHLSYSGPGNLYLFGIDTLHFQSSGHVLNLHGVFVKPTVSKQEFYREVGKQKEIYEGRFPDVQFNGFNWERFITDRSVYTESIDVGDADLEIYLNRIPPANTQSKVGNYPHQLLQKLGLPVHIPVLNLNRGSFRYTELNEKSKLAGTLDFNSIHGQILNITNEQAQIEQNSHCTIKLFGKFMRKSDMMAIFDFPLPGTNGRFSVKGQLQDLDASQISDAAKALALAEIKSLKLHRMDFNISGNDSVSDGQFTIRYNDLKIKLQKVDTATQRMHGRGFLSFIANELLLYNDNPMDGEDLRTATTHVARDPNKSFFNLIWRNIFNAGVQTALRNDGAIDLVKKRQANKGKEKVHFFRKLFPKRNKKNKDNPGQ